MQVAPGAAGRRRSARRAAMGVALAVAVAVPAVAVGSAGASPRTARARTATWSQVAELRAAPNANGLFGYAVAASGDVAVVGAPDVGRAYVFERRPTGWQQAAVLRVAGLDAFDFFGSAVAVWNTTVVVGAPGVGGRVFVFRRGAGSWHLWQELRGSDTVATDDDFGSSVSVAANRIAVGAPSHLHKGAVYLFGRSGHWWTQLAELRGLDTQVNDDYGTSVSVSPQFLAVGAAGHGQGRGAAYVYSRAEGWSQVAELSGRRPDEVFGRSVATYGETVVVGAPGPFTDRLPRLAGRAYVFETAPGHHWAGVAVLRGGPSSLGSFFGYAVAASYAHIVVGAYTNLPLRSPTYVYVQHRHWLAWVPIARVVAPDLPTWSLFGQSVAATGSTAFVGAPAPRDVGRAYVFQTPNA